MAILLQIKEYFEEQLFDWQYGVETSKQVERYRLEMKNITHAKRYQATIPSRFKKMIKKIPASIRKAGFVDFGSGKGRVLLLAKQAGFDKVYGVESDSNLIRQARYNVAKSAYENIHLFHMDALDFQIPKDASLFYFYNPFDVVIMEKVVGNILDSLQQCPREAYIVYLASIHQELFYSGRFQLIFEEKKRSNQTIAIYRINPKAILSFAWLLKNAELRA